MLQVAVAVIFLVRTGFPANTFLQYSHSTNSGIGLACQPLPQNHATWS